MKSEYKNFTRNRNAIRLAFADLMLKYGDINKITIMEIVKVAQISRGTFYSHYKSIDEVILDIGKEFGEKLKILLEKYNNENYLINSLPYFEELHDFLNKNKELYIKLLQAGQGPVISQYIKTAVYSSMYEMPILRDQYIDQERFKFDLNFFVSGSVQVVLDNLVDSNLQINRDRIVNMINNKFIEIFVNSRK
jgi:AcrR family transcriptional regulator